MGLRLMRQRLKPIHPAWGHGKWHRWYAWRPTYVDNDEVRALVWLEPLLRRRVIAADGRSFFWEYNLLRG